MAVCFPSTTDNFVTLVLSIAILLVGLGPTAGAPTAQDEEWWINPCSKQPPIRHGRSAAENQLKIFIHKIDVNFFRDIKALYNPVENKQMKGNCPRINNMLKPIKNSDSITTATQVFYETLLQFAVFIDTLKDIPIQTTGEFNFSKRKNIFEEAKENLRLVICEFNDTLTKYDNNKNVKPNKPKVPKINMKCLPKSLDLSDAHLMDTDFFKKMKKFLRQSRRLLKMKKRKGGKVVKSKSDMPKNKKRTKHVKN